MQSESTHVRAGCAKGLVRRTPVTSAGNVVGFAMTRKQISRRFQIDQDSDFSVHLVPFRLLELFPRNMKKDCLSKKCSTEENS